MLLELLKQEPIVNYGFIKYLGKYEVRRAAFYGSSCAATFGFGDEHFGALYSKDEDEARRVCTVFEGITDLAIEPAFDWSIAAALGERLPSSVLHATMLYLPEGVEVGEPSGDVVEIGDEHTETVYSNYARAELVNREYIRERLAEGPAVGVFRGGALVGWALTHDDMAMGMLTVLPEHRRQGIAYDMTLALIRKMRQIGEVPIVHISKGNSMSLPLVRKLGFLEICDVMFIS